MEYIILWILALFGVWSIISNITESIYSANKEACFDVILSVYNQEDTIEILIRQLSKIDIVGKIKVIDNGSTDNTISILKKIQKSNRKVVLENDTYEIS